MSEPNTVAPNCLTGVRVLDFTQFEAGTSCTQVMAWLGADVAKIENPAGGDPGRRTGATNPHRDDPYFLNYNSNKRSPAINLKDPRGLALVKQMAAKADVFMENFAPGAIERKDLINDPRFANREARPENEAELDRVITEFTSKRDKYECMRIIGAAVPAGAVRDTLELLNDENFVERGIIQKIQHPTNGAFKMAGWPVRFDGRTAPVKPAPLPGQHSAEVLKDWLGMDEQQIVALRSDKII
jgi:crotonobetainyl-CoA:carnitine CoA-transferase CaiB-like acyl-CoA transferase